MADPMCLSARKTISLLSSKNITPNPEIYVNTLEMRPENHLDGERLAEIAFNRIFTGNRYVIDGPIVIDAKSVVNSGCSLIGGAFVNPHTGEAEMLRIQASTLGEMTWATDSNIDNSVIEGGPAFISPPSSVPLKFFARFVLSNINNSFLSGRFDAVRMSAVDSFVELDEKEVDHSEGIKLERTVVPRGRPLDVEIIGLMQEEISLAKEILEDPFRILGVLRAARDDHLSRKIDAFRDMPKEGRMTSTAAALVAASRQRDEFSSEIAPLIEQAGGADNSELIGKFNLIAKCLKQDVRGLFKPLNIPG